MKQAAVALLKVDSFAGCGVGLWFLCLVHPVPWGC